MKLPGLLLLIGLFLSLGHSSASAQIWKNSEKKQAINREATVKKRLINNENALKNSKDATLQGLYKQRIAILKAIENDIIAWNEKIEADEKTNSQRYNFLTNLKLGKVDALQLLINIRAAEIVYETFGGDFKAEPVNILKELRGNAKNNLKAYDEAINKATSNIQ